MPRNFFRRVEALFPIDDPDLRRRITEDILPIEMRDNEDARELQPNGVYVPPPRAPGEEPFRAQKYFMVAAGLRATPQVTPAPAPLPAVAGAAAAS